MTVIRGLIFDVTIRDTTTMTRFKKTWLAHVACCCAMAVPSLAWQAGNAGETRRLYVEPFTTKEGSEKLREDVLAEVRKLSSVSLVSGESSADLILGGGGEMWIKGYISLNPRSGRLPSNGTPVYAGYLSVELRNTEGITLWSYLATPPAGSRDVSKDLAKRIAKNLPEGLEQAGAPSRTPSPPQPATSLKGAGATFPYPVYEKWFANYRRENPNLRNHRMTPSGRRPGFADCLPASWISELQTIRKQFMSLPLAKRAIIYSSRRWSERWSPS